MALVFALLGPSDFGAVVLSQSALFYVSTLCTLGLDAYIARGVDQLDRRQIGELYSVHLVALLLGVSLATGAAAIFYPANQAELFLGFSIATLVRGTSTIPVSVSEGRLDFRAIGRYEVLSQIGYVATLAPLLCLPGLGVSAVPIAAVVSAAIYSVLVLRRYAVRPAIATDPSTVRHALSFGVRLQAVNWIWQARDLLFPIALNALAGAGAVGMYGLASQVAQKLGFVRTIVWRVSVPSIAALKDAPDLGAKVARAGFLQTLAMSIALLFVACALTLLDQLGGEKWRGVSYFLPPVALYLCANAIFSIACAGLVTFGKLGQLAVFHVTFVLASLLGLALVSGTNIVGGLWTAEALSCSAYILLYRYCTRALPGFRVGSALSVLLVAMAGMSAAVYSREVILVVPSLVLLGINRAVREAFRNEVLGPLRLKFGFAT